MSVEPLSDNNPRVQDALEELKGLIRARYPGATFTVSRGEDPEGVHLDAIVDVADTDDVMDLLVERLLELQVEEGLPVYVIAVRPPERVLEQLRARGLARPARAWLGEAGTGTRLASPRERERRRTQFYTHASRLSPGRPAGRRCAKSRHLLGGQRPNGADAAAHSLHRARQLVPWLPARSHHRE